MLVGRATERQVVDGLVSGARVGQAGVLVVTGEAGIGKTTLLDYARSRADGVRLLRAAGNEAERDVPFGGLSQLLRPTDDDLGRLPGPQAEALAVALALRPGVVADRLTVGAAVLTLLVRYSEERPVGVLVDDAHVLDRPSAEALAFACRRFLADAVFVVVATRSGEPGPLTSAGLPELVLGGLDEAAVAELAARGDRRTTGEHSRLLHRVTGGNPLAVLGLVHDAGLSLSSALGSPTPIAVPAALTDWYARRISALGEDPRRLLLLAATAGGDLTVVSRAAAALGLSLTGLADAERAGLVTLDPRRIAFDHPLVRASVYTLAFPDERRAAHRAVAEALPAQDADRRAWHRAEASLGPDDEVADELEGVGDRARARGAHAVSAAAYERAARTSGTTTAQAHRLLSAAEACWQAGDPERTVDLVEEAIRLDPTPATGARGLALRGEVAAHCGAPGEAQRLLLAAADAVAPTDPSHAALLVAEAVSAGFFHGSAAAALAAGQRLEALAHRDLSPVARAIGTLATGMARVLAGLPGIDRIRDGAALLDAATPDERASVRPAWLMFGPLFLRESGSVRGLVRTALDEGRERSAISTLPMLLFTLARDGATTEHWSGAEADYAEAIALSREIGHTTELAVSLAGLSWLEARRGRVAQCREHAAQTLELCARHPVDIARVWAELALGELALSLGDVVEAVEVLTRLDGSLREIDLRDPDLSPAPDLAEALLRRGDVTEARHLVARFHTAAEAKGLPWAMARAERLRGLVAHPSELDDRFAAALALHAQTLDVFEEARTRLAYGACLRRVRRRADARGELRAALGSFERLGAVRWADTAAAELEATGESVARAGASPSGALTPRETQIALLLAEGRTTRQAAAALFLSPKTVEYHLRHVYTKLGIASRAELVATLDRRSDRAPEPPVAPSGR